MDTESVENLLLAAVDLPFHRNETGVSLTTGLEYGMERQNVKWNGFISECTLLQLTCVTVIV